MKVTVRIHRPEGLEFKTKKIEDDGKVTLRKRGKHRAEWRVRIDGVEAKHKWFGRVQYFTDVFQDAPASWAVDTSKKEVNKPYLTKDDVIAFGDWEALRARFRSIKDIGKTPFISYIILLAIVMNIIITFLLFSGRLRL